MASSSLTDEAREENAITLAALLGLDRESATEALCLSIVLTFEPGDEQARSLAHEVNTLLVRTVENVSESLIEDPAAEVVFGCATPQTAATHIYVSIDNEHATVGTGRVESPVVLPPHPVLALLTACYITAVTLFHATGRRLPFNIPDPLEIRFQELGIDCEALEQEIDIGHAHLAGAGAIGNGFLWAARHLQFRGRLEVIDDDKVSSGNLNRQIWFDRGDIGKPKANRLADKARASFPLLHLEPRPSLLQDLPDREGTWLRRLIVAVDSRRARRTLQNEIPGEVFDASTTDIRDVVIHYHLQPTDLACLSCIYGPDEEELTREAHIADHLGVSVEEVRSERISESAAKAISSHFPSVPLHRIVGEAYDSFYKARCSEGQLQTLADKRVIAPFAFVSVLAGTLLALEMVRRLSKGRNAIDFNYWRVSPWHPPLARRQVSRPKQSGCLFCDNHIMSKLTKSLWGIPLS